MANLSKLSLPLGYRFLPSDVVLLMHYLKRRVTGRPFKLKGDIPYIALNNFSPSEVRELSYPKTKDLEGFFFCSPGSRYSNGQRKNRSSKCGYWKATGKDKAIYNKSHKVGWRRTLTFYRGKAPGTITDWHIHEYRLEDKELPIASNNQNEFVLCKIFGPKTDEEYESPVEEDADESSSIRPEEGQSTVATISPLDFENRQDTVLQPLPPHTATPIVPQHHPSSRENDVHKLLLNVSDEDGDTCNGGGSRQVDSVPNKSTGEDVDTPEIYKNLGDISGQREMNLLVPGLTEEFLEEEDLSKPMEDEEGYFNWEDFLIPMVADGSNHGTSDCLLAANVTPVLPANEAMDSCDYENIPGYREPTCDSAARSPLKAGEIVGPYAPQSLARGLTEGFLEEDLSKPMEDEEGYFNWEDFLIPMAADGSNHGTSDCLLATNVTPVLPAHEAMDICDYENISGYREPTCDSAAHSPLKAGEIVGPYAPQSLARGKQLNLHLGLECIWKEGWFLTNVQFLLGYIVASPASATVYPFSLDCESYRVGCGFSCSIIVKDEVTIIYTHDGLLGMSRSFPFWSYFDLAEMLGTMGTISLSIDFMFVFILSAVSALTGALCACCWCQTWEASMAAPFAALL